MNWTAFVSALDHTERDQLRNALLDYAQAESALTEREQQMIIHGRVIDAIKAVKDRLCLSLRESRDIVENFRRRL